MTYGPVTKRDSRPGADRVCADALTDVGPGSAVVGLDDREIAVLRQVGARWGRALDGRRASLRALPVDPALHRFPRSPTAAGGGRFVAIDFVAGEDAGEVVATPHAGTLPSGLGRVAAVCRRVLFGLPLSTAP
jgi:hypothetical protein